MGVKGPRCGREGEPLLLMLLMRLLLPLLLLMPLMLLLLLPMAMLLALFGIDTSLLGGGAVQGS